MVGEIVAVDVDVGVAGARVAVLVGVAGRVGVEVAGATVCVGVGSAGVDTGLWPGVTVMGTVVVRTTGVGKAVGGIHCVGVGSRVSVGGTTIVGGRAVAVAVSVGVSAGWIVAVAARRWRVGVGVIGCGGWPMRMVPNPKT